MSTPTLPIIRPDGFNQLVSWENLLLAYRKAAKGKRGKAGAAAFEHNLESNLLSLQRALRSRTYRPGQYTSFYIHEPKRRLISAAPFRDRVIHHALCNVIEPRFERLFIPDSYANRVGKGTHRALNKVEQYARRFKYVLPSDVRQFFPSIDHLVLKHVLFRIVKDKEVQWLIEQILESGKHILTTSYDPVIFPGDDLFSANRARGLPIGNLTSQFWANVYMNPFDQFVLRELRCKGYVRYVDDFLLFADDKRLLWEWKAQIIKRMARIRLTIHPRAHPRPVTEGIPFLGFVSYPHKRKLKRRKGIYYQRKLKQLLNSGDEDALAMSTQGWVNHVRYGNTVGLQKKMLASIDLYHG